MADKIVACITTYNEADTIGWLVDKLPFPVVVVDASSSDGTVKVAQRHGAVVYRCHNREPIGSSMMMAWRIALREGADRIVQLDAGGSHLPQDADGLLSKNADIVVGSRFIEYGFHSGKRAVLSRLASKMCNLVSGTKCTDWSSGYRVFTAEALEALLELNYRAEMHGWQIEVLWKANQLNLDIEEAPITYLQGESAFSLSTAIEAFAVWWGILRGS